MAHIFISYSHKDTEYAHALAASLQGMGFETWIDERLDYGAQWPQELQTRLDTCSAFILIMSPRSYASEWVQSELQRAKRKLKPIFPLLLEGDEPWLSVESTQYYDVRGEVYPDARFYNTLKNVMTSTPGARTLQYPKGSVKAKSTKESSKLNIGLVAGAIVLLLIFGIGYAALRMRSAQETPAPPTVSVQQPATSAPVSNEFTSVPGAAATAQATEAQQISNAGDDMVLVPAGEFTMGIKAAEEFAACQKFGSDCNVTWFTDEEPVHTVPVDAFYIDKYEVTNALYKACVDQGACDPPQDSNSSTHLNYYGNSEFDHYPVIYVTWNQAKAYCEWRGKRLPTEAEWEKAARGTDGRMYPWGDNLNETFANFNYSVGDTTPVGSYENGKSPYGAYDMAGNVWEWVSSQDRPYPYTPDDGRESARGEELRVARGGSWGLVGVSVSTSYRYGFKPTSSNLDLGFRCARDANP